VWRTAGRFRKASAAFRTRLADDLLSHLIGHTLLVSPTLLVGRMSSRSGVLDAADPERLRG
jgi:hypothetical protein